MKGIKRLREAMNWKGVVIFSGSRAAKSFSSANEIYRAESSEG